MSNILLSNLIKIRWIAIFGQLIAILFVYFILKINIFLIPCIFALITSVSVNFYSYFLQKKKNRFFKKCFWDRKKNVDWQIDFSLKTSEKRQGNSKTPQKKIVTPTNLEYVFETLTRFRNL